jgi:hypothetical protein
MRKLVALIAVLGSGLVGVEGRAASEVETGHRFGEWPAISAIIPEERQQNLNLDDKDFLIEIWFKPLPVLKYKGNTPNVLISKKCGELLPGYTLSYLGTTVALTLCDQLNELERDVSVWTDAGIKEGEWCYFAVSYSHAAKTFVFYRDGKRIGEFPAVDLGTVSNKDPFNIGYFENSGNTPAHCVIREARVWKLVQGLPEDIAAVVAAHQANPQTVSATLGKAAAFSRWAFTSGNDDVSDLGNNGNALCYVPWGVKEDVRILPLPKRPAGTTRYVDAANPKATDDGAGTRRQPFKTIKRGLKATGPGDVLHLSAGVYRDTIYPRAGENGKPVTIEGDEGTTILGSDPIEGWMPADEGTWRVTNWTGNYVPPSNPLERDERASPGHLLLVDDYPLDYVKTKAELVPGTWTLEPLLGQNPKTITICPLPGVDPRQVPVEITVRVGLTATKFTHVRGLRFLRGGVTLRGIGNVLENNTIEWAPYCTLGISGQRHVVRGNRIFWGGNTGVAGSSYGLTFEDNVLSYNGWRKFEGGWGGGAIKFIPSNIDHVLRHNEFCYNQIAAIWYDTNNQGNLIEGNRIHDNATGGLFDEFCFGNTFQSNVIYNNSAGINIANTSEDRVYRNICFNNDAGGMFFRSGGPKKKNTEEVYRATKEEFTGKLDVRRYQGVIPYAREKRFRDAVEKYTWWYPEGTLVASNAIIENVIFNNYAWGGLEVNQPVCYVKGAAIDLELVNTFVRNIYWNDLTNKIFNNGSYGTHDFTLPEWQEASGQDQGSLWLNPFDHPDQMPAWFKAQFPFKKDDFRSIHQVLADYLPSLNYGVAKTVLTSRLVRSRRIEVLPFSDPALTGVGFNCDGRRCASLWSKGAGMRTLLLPDVKRVTVENRFLQRKEFDVVDRRLSLFVNEHPVTLIGVGPEIREDRSVAIDLPHWSEPGKPVAGKLALENRASQNQDYALKLSVKAGWTIKPANVDTTLKAGQKSEIPVELLAPSDVREGLFQLCVAGTVGGRNVAQSQNFGLGALLTLKSLSTGPHVEDDFSKWTGNPPNGLAENKNQVVFGGDAWKGPQDLSAKAWLGWNADRELYLAIDVTDDTVVTNHNRPNDDPTKSDSVELFVDVRAPWKQYMPEYTPGVFKLVLMPGGGKHRAFETEATRYACSAYRYEGTPFGDIGGVNSQVTDKGYRIVADIHFHGGEVESPGWVANREVRIGLLVHDSDDPNGQSRKATIGVWRTAADAGENCVSFTTFVTEQQEEARR